MHKTILIIMILCSHCVFGQDAVEVKKIEISPVFRSTFDSLQVHRDSIYRAIEILEQGLARVENDYEKYTIIMNLGYLYTFTNQYDKSIDMWMSANNEGLFMPIETGDHPFPSYLSSYTDNKRFNDYFKTNERLKEEAGKVAKTEYFVCLPEHFAPACKYPLIIILHGGVGDNMATFRNWDANSIKDSFIAVYPRGRKVVGSFARRYGETGLDDINEVYKQVIAGYPVDTLKVILAGQSAGGALSLGLAYNKIPVAGLLLAFPVKPGNFDVARANEFKNKDVRIVMIYGEKDEDFFPGQKELSHILDSAGVENRFIRYPDLGHGFPPDFSEQIDKGLRFLLKNE